MKSGLEGRNNWRKPPVYGSRRWSRNEVRPRRPEQWGDGRSPAGGRHSAAMKSGLEGRNNVPGHVHLRAISLGRNEVRPRRPEQSDSHCWRASAPSRRNEVRPRRPEQSDERHLPVRGVRAAAMKSGLEGRNNPTSRCGRRRGRPAAMKSGLEGRNNKSVTRVGSRRQRRRNEVRPRRPEQWGENHKKNKERLPQ